MAAFFTSTGVILTPMSIVFFKLQHLHFAFLVLWVISKQACRLAGLSTWWTHLVVASPYPCCALKAVGKNLNGFDCLEGWWGVVCYWNREKFLWRGSWLQARLVVTSKSAWQLSSTCLGYREDWLVQQWWQTWWLVNHDENPTWFSSWSWLTLVNNAERWASSIDNIDKKPLLNLMPLENSSIRLGLERILRLVEITWPWWESTKLGKRKQTQPEWIIL